MTFCPEHPKWDRNPKFTPLSETTSIPAAFIWGPPPPGYLFSSKYHQRDFCKKAGCCDFTNNEATKIAKQTYKFQHSWLNKRSMSFCVTTEMWWSVYVEGEGLFCLLCKKHNTSNPQNKSKVLNKEPCKRFRPEEFEDHCRTSQQMNTVSAEMLQRVSVFQRTLDERERVAEDVLLKVFPAAYWIMKEELPNNNIKSHVSPWAYMYSRLAATKKPLQPAFT